MLVATLAQHQVCEQTIFAIMFQEKHGFHSFYSFHLHTTPVLNSALLPFTFLSLGAPEKVQARLLVKVNLETLAMKKASCTHFLRQHDKHVMHLGG